MNKIHVVEFTSGTTAKTITGLFQWNFGQILQIKGLDLPSAVEVHFALRRSGEAIRRIGVTKDGVTEVEIPDVLFKTMMTSDYDIYAYVYVSDEEYGSTTHEIILKVKSRPMPDDVSDNFEKIMEAVKAIADGKVDKEQGVENNGKFLGVVDGYVALMDAPSGGTANAVQYVAQELTEEQQEQARANIGAANVIYDTETKTLNICLGGGTTNGLIEQIEDYVIENEIEKIVIDGVEVNLSRYAKKEETDRLSEEIANKAGTGLSTEAIDKLEEVGNYLAYTTADGGSKWTELISILRNGSSGGGSGETVTLQSISATYTGGDVTVGTALIDLTGITVTGTYSDGSTSEITGYTLSGEIVEGSNTITVSYSGLTTTFTVTGVAEESGANETTAWDNASEYSFSGIVKNVRNAKATGTFAYQSISTDYIQMFDTGLGNDWKGITIIDEEGEFTISKNKFQLWFQYVNKEYGLRIHQSIGTTSIGAIDSSNDDYYKIENGIYYAKSRFTSEGYQPFVVGHRYRWFAW